MRAHDFCVKATSVPPLQNKLNEMQGLGGLYFISCGSLQQGVSSSQPL